MESFKDKFRYAFCGLKIACKDKAVRLQLCLMGIAILLAFLMHFNLLEYCIVLLCCTIIVVLECINSLIEKVMDFIHPNFHERVKEIKDLGAGIVLMAAMIILVIGILLYGSKLLLYLG